MKIADQQISLSNCVFIGNYIKLYIPSKLKKHSRFHSIFSLILCKNKFPVYLRKHFEFYLFFSCDRVEAVNWLSEDGL